MVNKNLYLHLHYYYSVVTTTLKFEISIQWVSVTTTSWLVLRRIVENRWRHHQYRYRSYNINASSTSRFALGIQADCNRTRTLSTYAITHAYRGLHVNRGVGPTWPCGSHARPHPATCHQVGHLSPLISCITIYYICNMHTHGLLIYITRSTHYISPTHKSVQIREREREGEGRRERERSAWVSFLPLSRFACYTHTLIYQPTHTDTHPHSLGRALSPGMVGLPWKLHGSSNLQPSPNPLILTPVGPEWSH